MDKHKSNRRIFTAPVASALLSMVLVVFTTLACAAEPVRIGVQAFRAKAQMLAQWQPLAAALKQAIPEREFIIEPLTNEEMGNAVATRQVDFVLTNPSNYAVIAKRSGLSSPLATLADDDHGREVTVFGGVIFSRYGQEKINSLSDIAGKTIAATTIDALGSYQMQAYELSRARVHLPQDAKVIFTGSAQDNVVAAVLSGHADVGFVRTGLLESMAREGKLDMAQLKIINRQNMPGYTAALSTHLYPNWPFAALPHIDENLARRVAVALFSLEENTAATRAMRIHGFVVPADYTPVEALLQELHLPPYDVTPEISLRDVWAQYHWWVSIGLLAAGLILLLGYRLWLSNYRLRAGIAERKLAEEKLQHMNERFSLASRAAGLGIWDWDIRKNELAWDDGMYALYGVKREDFAGAYEAWLQGIHPDDRAASDEISKQAQRGEREYDTEFRVVWPDGSVHYLKAYGQFVRDAEGKPLRMTGVNYDITERKRVEDALRRSEHGLLEAQRLAHLGSWHMDLATNEVFWSEELYNIYGFDSTLPPPLYTESMKLFTPESWERLSSSIARAVETGASYELELETVNKEGGRGWMLARGELVRDASGAAVGVRGVVMDITERKRMESQLVEREYQFRTLAENSPDVIVRYDREGRRIYVNPEFERVNHLSAQQVLGKTPAELSTELKPKADEFTEQLMAAMASGTSTKVDLAWTKEGQQICWFVRVVPEFDADGKVVSALTIWSDISERKRAEEEIRIFNRELEQRVAARTADLEAANKELEAFSYSVSHDLRTPLRAIDGFSGILLEDYADKLDEEGQRLLNVVRGNTIRMGQLIDDILKFSRTGRLEIAVSEIDMEKLAHEVFEEIEPSMAGAKLQVEIEHIPPSRGDRAMMRQVFVNLLSNAIKFSRLRENVKIKVGGSIEGGQAVYYVQDNGVGFDMQYANKLFGVFQRLHGMDEFEGTGIGLAIVKRIVTRHGGRVWAEGKVNEGATIYFSIPAPGNDVSAAS